MKKPVNVKDSVMSDPTPVEIHAPLTVRPVDHDDDTDPQIRRDVVPTMFQHSRPPELVATHPFGISTNLDMSTRVGKCMFLLAGNPGSIQFDENGRAEILVTRYVLFPDRGTDPETGELSEFTRCVLFDRDGNTFRTTAAHAAQRLAWMLSMFSKEEWDEGLPFVITERVSRKTRRTYHDIRLATPKT